MPSRKMQEIRDMSKEERERRLSELRTELVRMRTMVKAGGAVENPAKIPELKKTVARILTAINEESNKEKQK